MKILYHHRTAAQDGQTVHIEEMLKALRAAGHEVLMVGPRMRAKSFGKSSGFLSLLRKFVPAALYELMELAYSVRAYAKLSRAYNEFQPDILYERYNLYLLSGAWLSEKKGIPYILEVNSPLSQERYKYGDLKLLNLARKIEQRCWKAADMCLPVTQVLADILVDNGVKPDKITVIHNGIDPDKFNSNMNSASARSELKLDGKTVLGFTGFVREWHKLDDIIRLIATNKEKHNLHLLVIGDGLTSQESMNLAHALGVDDCVTFLGLVERDKVGYYTSAFDIALQPAVTNYASPLKIFEYLAMGIPIIAPDQPNIREILTSKYDSILFNPDIKHSLEDAIMAMVDDPAICKKLGDNAKITLHDRQYYWSSNAEKVINISQKLMAYKKGD